MGIFDFLKKKKQMPATIEEGMASQAEDFIRAFTGDGAPVDARKLDYSEASLDLVDKILDDFYKQKADLPDDLHFLASAYVFECARKAFGGRYLRGDDDDPFVLVIGEPTCQIGVLVMGKIRGRAVNGPEDNIRFFYEGIAPLVKAGKNATLT